MSPIHQLLRAAMYMPCLEVSCSNMRTCVEAQPLLFWVGGLAGGGGVCAVCVCGV